MLKRIKNNYGGFCPYNMSKTEPFIDELLHPPIFRSQNRSLDKELMEDYYYFNNLTFDDLHDTSAGDKMPDAGITFKKANSSVLMADLKVNDLRTL